MATINPAKTASHVLSTPPAEPSVAAKHFAARLAFETDPWDLHEDLENKVPGILVIDARSPDSFAVEHIPGAVSFHHRKISLETVARIPKDVTLVVYCAGVHCNAAPKAAAKFSALGFKVKELLHGLDGWKREGYPVERGTSPISITSRA